MLTINKARVTMQNALSWFHGLFLRPFLATRYYKLHKKEGEGQHGKEPDTSSLQWKSHANELPEESGCH